MKQCVTNYWTESKVPAQSCISHTAPLICIFPLQLNNLPSKPSIKQEVYLENTTCLKINQSWIPNRGIKIERRFKPNSRIFKQLESPWLYDLLCSDKTCPCGNLPVPVFLTRNWTQWEDGVNQEKHQPKSPEKHNKPSDFWKGIRGYAGQGILTSQNACKRRYRPAFVWTPHVQHTTAMSNCKHVKTNTLIFQLLSAPWLPRQQQAAVTHL